MNVYNFFKFLNEKKETSIPFRVKIIYAPETLKPEELKVDGSLLLNKTPIKSLPEGLSVGGNLNLIKTQITSLPEGLSVGGYLFLHGSQIQSLPNNLKVGGTLHLRNTPIAEKYSMKEIIKMVPGAQGDIII